ncbi:hypothetical protein ADU59_18100 [Pararhizobium polonicum]|uniref:SHOCT domain-containing protein n=1 Tax=Pararhizobium polonicum TaxID=1612624 RepID=A0A1C7NYR2_9HYPH|nr:hypothetical protein ADU59_18100 [Pararhizobium polonicum]
MMKSGKAAMMRMVTAFGLAGLAIALAGCNSTAVDEQPSIYSATMAKPIPADVYPVIEGKLPAATTQMSNEEAASQQAKLTALGSARSSGAISEAEYQRRLKELQLLAANHGADTLKQIQN